MKVHPLLPGPEASEFLWASGIEDTFVPQTRPGHRALDEYQLMGHYEHWREDLGLARDLGVRALRWGIPWYRVEKLPGELDWSWTDQVIPYMVEELKINPILDLMHYGCPFWLRREFASDEYRRPWPPTPGRSPSATKGSCAGTRRSTSRTGLSRAARADLHALAVEDRRRGYLAFDLISGRVDHDHPLFTWLVRNGAGPDELRDLARQRVPLDVLGLNFYPQWSTQQLSVDRNGRLRYRAVELYTLPRWKATHLVERFQAYMADPGEAVGDLAPALELASA